MNFITSYYHVYVFFQISLILAAGISADQKSSGTYKSSFLLTADSLLKKEQYDDALVQYFLASENGMPQDSLYYFWAELYINKGDLDSALAANSFALKNTDTTTIFGQQLFQQRYSIYLFLGAGKQAKEIWKKISVLNGNKRGEFKASIKTYLSLRYEPEKVDFADPSYWTSGKDSISNEISSLFRITGNFQFQLPPNSFPDFSLGPFFQLKKSSSLPGSISSALDSLNFDAGGYISLDNLFNSIRIELRSSINSDRYLTKRWINGLSYSYINAKGTFLSAGGYNISLQKNLDYDYQFGYQSFILDMKRHSILFSPSLTISSFASKHNVIYDNALSSLSLLYFNSSRLNGKMVPLFYNDAQMRTPLDTSGLNGNAKMFYINRYANQMQQSSTPVTAMLDLPLSYFRIEPGINAEIPVNKWSLKPGIRFNIDIYNGLYRWHDFDLEHLTPYLAVDPSTNNYYQINGISDQGTVNLSSFGIGEKTGSFFTRKRLDSGIQGEISMRRTFKKAGTFNISLHAGKFWTNLPRSCPVNINSWTVMCNADWNYTRSLAKVELNK